MLQRSLFHSSFLYWRLFYFKYTSTNSLFQFFSSSSFYKSFFISRVYTSISSTSSIWSYCFKSSLFNTISCIRWFNYYYSSRSWFINSLSSYIIDSIRITRHYSRGFPVYDDSITPLFLLLSSEHILFLLQSILLEQKVLIHSIYPSIIVNVVHTCKRLLFPWKYAGSFIPLLPSSMLLAVQVPGSFIIGIETVWFFISLFNRNILVHVKYQVKPSLLIWIMIVFFIQWNHSFNYLHYQQVI